MRIKVTAGELSVMGQSLLELLNAEMPGDVGYRVARMAKKLMEEVGMAEQAKIDIIQKHGGTQDKTTGGWTIEPDSKNYPKAAVEINKMMAEEIELNIDCVTLPPQIRLKPHILITLEKFVSVAEE